MAGSAHHTLLVLTMFLFYSQTYVYGISSTTADTTSSVSPTTTPVPQSTDSSTTQESTETTSSLHTTIHSTTIDSTISPTSTTPSALISPTSNVNQTVVLNSSTAYQTDTTTSVQASNLTSNSDSQVTPTDATSTLTYSTGATDTTTDVTPTSIPSPGATEQLPSTTTLAPSTSDPETTQSTGITSPLTDTTADVTPMSIHSSGATALPPPISVGTVATATFTSYTAALTTLELTTVANDPCVSNPCQNSASCTPVNSTLFSCACKVGFQGSTCAEDINECSTNKTICDKDINSFCTNLVGSHQCVCLLGYFRNATYCDKVEYVYPIELTAEAPGTSEWRHLPGTGYNYQALKNAIAITIEEQYTGVTVLVSSVNTTWRITREVAITVHISYSIYSSKPINITNDRKNDTLQLTLPYNTTTNLTLTISNWTEPTALKIQEKTCPVGVSRCDNRTAGCVLNDFRPECQCRSGYQPFGPQFSWTFGCEDINECLSNGTDCSSNAKCENTIGSYRCVCDPGFKKTESTECAAVCENNPCGSHGQCSKKKDVDNTHACSCDSGYTGASCDVKDEGYQMQFFLLVGLGSGLGALTIICFIAVIVVCCARKSGKSYGPDFEVTSAFTTEKVGSSDGDQWAGRIPRPQISKLYDNIDVEGNYNGQVAPSGKKDSGRRISAYINEAYEDLDLYDDDGKRHSLANGDNKRQEGYF